MKAKYSGILKRVSSLTAASRLKIQQAEPNEFDTRLVHGRARRSNVGLFGSLYSIAILFCPTANDYNFVYLKNYAIHLKPHDH